MLESLAMRFSCLSPRLILIVSCAALAACESGPSGATRQHIASLLAQRDYAGADAYLDSVKESQYGQKNEVLFYLDKGAVQHDEGKYKESDQSFELAEKRMDDLYTVSLSKAGGMLLLNDNTVDYAGEPFEHTLLNVYRALDYVFLNQPEEALVESRKVEEFLTQLQRKVGKAAYSDDAFARYLDAMLYADQGQMDDARISLNAARAAYANYAAYYGTPVPKFDLPKSDRRHGELVVIHYNGVAPRKISKTFQVAWNDAMVLVRQSDENDAAQAKNALVAGLTGNAITVAYPAIEQDPYPVASSEVWIDSKPAGSTFLMEDVTAIASRDLQDRLALIKTRAIARAAIKYVLAQVAYKAAAKGCEQIGGMTEYVCKGAAKATMMAAIAITEVADTRGWDTLPAQIRMARIKVPSGKHDVLVRFLDSAGNLVSTQEFPDVEIDARKRTYLAAASVGGELVAQAQTGQTQESGALK